MKDALTRELEQACDFILECPFDHLLELLDEAGWGREERFAAYQVERFGEM